MTRLFLLASITAALSLTVACSESGKADAKPADVKPTDAKPADVKPADAKPSDAKPTGAKPAGTKPGDVEGPAKEAATLLASRCAACHGTAGKGDGPAAGGLNPKPRSFGDPAWQKSVTDEHLAKVIVEGGAAVGKSPLMTANPDLKDKPEVVKALVKAIRAFGPAAAAK